MAKKKPAPAAPKRRRGRPEYQPTLLERERVEVMVAARLPVTEISARLGISRDTFYKHFKAELESGGARVIEDVLLARYNSAKSGNVAAQNALLKQAGLKPEEYRAPKPAVEPKAPRAPKLGKKEIQAIEAQTPDITTHMGELIALRESGAKVN